MVELRKVTENDIQKIYEWRNHPEIRKFMFNSDKIKSEDHVSYWKKRLADPELFSFIIMSEGRGIGFVKFDKMENGYDIGIVLDPSEQKKGLGTEAISIAIKKAKEFGIKKLIVRVKPENMASQKIFEKNDFKKVDDHYELEVK